VVNYRGANDLDATVKMKPAVSQLSEDINTMYVMQNWEVWSDND